MQMSQAEQAQPRLSDVSVRYPPACAAVCARRRSRTTRYSEYRESTLEEKRETVGSTLNRLRELKDVRFGTPTAQRLWEQRLDFNIVFYEKLQAQLENSTSIL